MSQTSFWISLRPAFPGRFEMTTAFVLMTAMPPTRGHMALIDFAAELAPKVKVLVCTQPDEPFAIERWAAIDTRYSDDRDIHVVNLSRKMEQNSEAPGFWDMWRHILDGHGMTEHDVVVSSEAYGQKVADLFGADFIPFDPNREILNVKATHVRTDPLRYFDLMAPEFQGHLRRRVTVFGAESVGKTTLSRRLADAVNGQYLPEWARPYLEMVGPELSVKKMRSIQSGQTALQYAAHGLSENNPFVIQDTDLFSTLGYWRMYSHNTVTESLRNSARAIKSDLYIILDQSEVPFHTDPLRYGGNKRESTDQYWIDLCEEFSLPYIYLHGSEWERVSQASDLCLDLFNDHAAPLRNYQRKNNA